MQTAKEANKFKFQHFNIELVKLSNQKIMLTITDQLSRLQYHEKLIELSQINVQTLIMAIQGTKKEVELKIAPKDHKNELLQLKITVSPKFLMTVQETILLRKSRTIPQEEFCLKQIQILSKRIREIKQNKGDNNIFSFSLPQEKYYMGATLQPILSMNLKKGTYLITVSLIAKPTNAWIYLYLNSLPTFNAHGGFYVPSGANYFPVTIRTVYTVNGEAQDVKINTNCASSYPIYVKNIIGVAKKIK